MSKSIKLIEPQWNAPSQVKAFSTTRIGGFSQGVYQGLNLGMHVNDDPEIVLQNRSLLPNFQRIQWLNQTHSAKAVEIHSIKSQAVNADASFTSKNGIVCAVMTADCLPILLCNEDGNEIAAIHAGWKGLAQGIVEETIRKMSSPVTSLLAWLGPAIGPECFEVGEDVFSQFNQYETQAFRKSDIAGKYLLDIYSVASIKLRALGVSHITSSDCCTYTQSNEFFSYRRDKITGRMVSGIWLEN